MDNSNQVVSKFELRHVVKLLSEAIVFLRRKVWGVLVIIVLGSLLGGYLAWRSTPLYTGNVTFMVSEDDGGRGGGLSAILGQLSIMNPQGGELNLDKIVQLSRSKRIIYLALLDSVILSGERDLLANHLIDSFYLEQKWRKQNADDFIGFRFTSSSLDSFSIKENIVIQDLYGHIVGNAESKKDQILTTDYNDAGILSINISYESEDVVVKIAQQVYKSLSNFYIEQSISSQKSTFNQIRIKADSIERQLKFVEYSLAKMRDRNTSIATSRERVREQQLNREAQLLMIMYGEVIKNRESADFVLKSITPVFNIIDDVRLPLRKSERSVPRNIVIGGILGFLFGVGGVVSLFLFKRAMHES